MKKPVVPNRTVIAVLIALAALLGLALTPTLADAQLVTDEEPVAVAPLPLTSVPMTGEVWANGTAIGTFDFALIWSEDDPSKVQLWTVLGDVPSLVCSGDVFDSPGGDPIFFGETSLLDPAGTCTMSQLPDRSAITMFAASDDGQWAVVTMRYAGSVEPAPIFD